MYIKEGILLPGAQAALYHLETPELGIAMTVTIGTHLIFLQTSITPQPITLCRQSHPTVHTNGCEGS